MNDAANILCLGGALVVFWALVWAAIAVVEFLTSSELVDDSPDTQRSARRLEDE